MKSLVDAFKVLLAVSLHLKSHLYVSLLCYIYSVHIYSYIHI